jgi:hypothetical protein
MADVESDSSSGEADPLLKEEDWRFKHAWSWYQDHVRHRATMLNYLLVSFGILANAYVALLKEKLFDVAGYLAVFAALITYSFLCLDVITLRKIQLAKAVLRQLSGPEPSSSDANAKAFSLILDSESRRVTTAARVLRLHKDRTWTFLIESGAVVVSLMAGAHALSASNATRGALLAVAVLALAPIAYASFRHAPRIYPSPSDDRSTVTREDLLSEPLAPADQGPS